MFALWRARSHKPKPASSGSTWCPVPLTSTCYAHMDRLRPTRAMSLPASPMHPVNRVGQLQPWAVAGQLRSNIV